MHEKRNVRLPRGRRQMYDMLGTHQKNENTPHLLRGKRYDMLHQVCKQKNSSQTDESHSSSCRMASYITQTTHPSHKQRSSGVKHTISGLFTCVCPMTFLCLCPYLSLWLCPCLCLCLQCGRGRPALHPHSDPDPPMWSHQVL